MGNNKIHRASEIIWNAIKNEKRIECLPKEIAPTSRNDAYQIQKNYKVFTDYEHIGYKIAATSIAGQKHINVSSPIAGMLFKTNLFYDKESIKFSKYKMGVAEPEFVFKLSKDVTQKVYNNNYLFTLIDELYTAIELPDTRFEDFENIGEFQLISDNSCAKYMFLGKAINTNIKDVNFENIKVTISTNKYKNKGNSSNALGSPLKALNWLINEAIEYKLPLKKGMLITTGTCTIPIKFKKKDTVIANFEGLSKIIANLNI